MATWTHRNPVQCRTRSHECSGAPHLFVHVRVQVADEHVGTHIGGGALVLAGLVHAYGLAIDFDHVQHADGLQGSSSRSDTPHPEGLTDDNKAIC